MKNFLRVAFSAAAVAVAAVGFAAPALAHVKVSGTDADQGGYGVLTFRVPTESDTAATTDLVVTFPDDQPVLSVSTQPKPGWTAHVVKKKLATPQKDDDGNDITDYVSTVEWKADTPQAAIPPNEFDMFSVSAGPLPKAETLSLPAVQTYSDGKVVSWNEKAAPGQPEPEHPAPVLKLASGDSEGAQTQAPAPQVAESAAAGAPAWQGVTALVLAIIAVLFGVVNLALLRRRS
ncbi:YcnI family protein [Mycobacterium sp. 141]|uniref:YcnI family protein n=1 Tax=Mycobacterium sp. 141 TaxID=1120797 RepID=UPI00039B04D1|nr:YcnI family protein [Mycobacterium sp. 141]